MGDGVPKVTVQSPAPVRTTERTPLLLVALTMGSDVFVNAKPVAYMLRPLRALAHPAARATNVSVAVDRVSAKSVAKAATASAAALIAVAIVVAVAPVEISTSMAVSAPVAGDVPEPLTLNQNIQVLPVTKPLIRKNVPAKLPAESATGMIVEVFPIPTLAHRVTGVFSRDHPN